MKNLLQNRKGITLIALVITIIIILILAGISIGMITGNNSMLTKTSEARKSTEDSQTIERIQVAYMGALANGLGIVNFERLNTELEKEFGTGNYKITPESDETNEWTIMANEVLFTVAKSGSVTVSNSGENNLQPTDYSDDVKTKLSINPSATTNEGRTPYVKYNGIICRVLYGSNSEYGIEIISENPVEEIILGKNDETEGAQGAKGTFERSKWSYNNAISTLNKAADKYVVENDGIVEYARCVGSVPGSKELRETKNSAEASQPPYLIGRGFEAGEEVSGFTANYIEDRRQLEALKISGVSDTSICPNYWLASRHSAGNSNNTGFNVKYSNAKGGLFNARVSFIYYNGANWLKDYKELVEGSIGLRPVFHLAPGAKIANDGNDGSSPEKAYILIK